VTAKCRVCAQPLTIPPVGRPPIYCSEGCRRSVAYAISRANRRIERLEQELDGLEVHGSGTSLPTRIRTMRHQLALAQAELRSLLDVPARA